MDLYLLLYASARVSAVKNEEKSKNLKKVLDKMRFLSYHIKVACGFGNESKGQRITRKSLKNLKKVLDKRNFL